MSRLGHPRRSAGVHHAAASGTELATQRGCNQILDGPETWTLLGSADATDVLQKTRQMMGQYEGEMAMRILLVFSGVCRFALAVHQESGASLLVSSTQLRDHCGTDAT